MLRSAARHQWQRGRGVLDENGYAQRAVRSAIVLGGSGLVGSRLVELWRTGGSVVAPSHAELDVLDDAALREFIAKSTAEVVLNAVAWADVDGAEAQRGDTAGLVHRLNTDLPGRLARLCQASSKYLVHISTDYVFDGSLESRPYQTDDAANPLSWYAQTKALGEQRVRDETDMACIARIEMPFTAQPHRKRDFARWCLARLESGDGIVGVADQRITPVFLDDVAEALARLIEQRARGTLHVAPTTWTTPFDFARGIARRAGYSPDSVSSDTFEHFAGQRPAPRPRHSWLDVTHTTDLIGPGVLRSVDDQLDAWIAQLRASKPTQIAGDRTGPVSGAPRAPGR